MWRKMVFSNRGSSQRSHYAFVPGGSAERVTLPQAELHLINYLCVQHAFVSGDEGGGLVCLKVTDSSPALCSLLVIA